MALHVALTHRTSYHYDRPVSSGRKPIRLRPAPHARTPILSYSLGIEPAGHFVNWQQDPQGNFLARVVFPERVTEFAVTVDLLADMATINPFDFFLEPDAEHVPFSLRTDAEDGAGALPRHRAGRAAAAVAGRPAGAGGGADGRLPGARQPRRCATGSATSCAWSPASGRRSRRWPMAQGSCRDSAWVLVQAFRHLGYAARFVSGYLIQLKPDIAAVEGPARRHGRTSPTCMPGPRSTCPAPAGSGWTQPAAC